MFGQSACDACSETWAQCRRMAQKRLTDCHKSVELECREKCKDDISCYRGCVGDSDCEARFDYDEIACGNDLEHCKSSNCNPPK